MKRIPNQESIQAILFDFDGVVVQSEDVYDLATTRLGKHFGVEIPEPFFESNRGIAERLFYERFQSAFQLEVPLDELQTVGRKYLWDAFSQAVSYTPGFHSFYAKMRKRVTGIALVTATPRPLLEQIFENSNIDVDFDHVVTSSDVENNKPAPDPYLKACELLHVEPGNALVVEDSPTGLQAASSAGCRTVAITTSCGRESLNKANFVVDSFGELEELLTIE